MNDLVRKWQVFSKQRNKSIACLSFISKAPDFAATLDSLAIPTAPHANRGI